MMGIRKEVQMLLKGLHRYRDEAHDAANIKAPLHVRSCGHYIVGKPWRDNPLKKNFMEFFWCIRGTGNFGCSGKVFQLLPDTVFFYLPGDFHDITTRTAPFEYYWFTLDGDNLENTISQFRIVRGVKQAGRCPVDLFEHLENHLRDYTARGEYLAGAAAYQILSLAFAGNEQPNSLFEQFKDRVQIHFSDPSLNVAFLAKELAVHRSTLFRAVQAASGMTPQEYICACRMQEALSLIRDSNWSFKEIAAEVGFRNQNYFAKVIRRKFAENPSWLRSHSG